jgi:3-hydroxybutyryl-CoA dehydratase
MKKGKTYDELVVGEKATFTKRITDEDIRSFAEISGDKNPIHIDDEFAAKSFAGKRIAHGMLVSGLISAVLGTILPGVGTVYLSQELRFKAPVFPGDEITAEVTVEEKQPKGRVKLNTVCKNAEGKVVIEGTAIVLPPR